MTDNNRTPGQLLRAAREAKSLTLADVAKELRLSTHAIESIEKDDYTNIGVRTFVRGYLVTFARVVGASQSVVLELFDELNPAPVAQPFSAASVVDGAPVLNVTREKSSFRYSPRVLVGAGVGLLIILGILFRADKGSDVSHKDPVPMKTFSSTTVQPIVIPATPVSPIVQPQPVNPQTPAEPLTTSKAVVDGVQNTGSNTPFVRKTGTHHTRKKAPASPFTVKTVSPENASGAAPASNPN